MTASALLITGTVGVGKTTVAEAAGRLLEGRSIPHALVDLDQIRLLWPHPDDDRFNLAIELRNLASLAENYRQAGAQRLIMAGVIERRLRMRHSDSPDDLAWHLDRCAELDAILDAAHVSDSDVAIADRTPLAVAAEVLQFAGW